MTNPSNDPGNLDALFSAIRKEAPVLTEGEVESMVRNAAMPKKDVSLSFGLRNMTLTGITLAALVGTGIFVTSGPTPESPVTPPAATQMAAQAVPAAQADPHDAYSGNGSFEQSQEPAVGAPTPKRKEPKRTERIVVEHREVNVAAATEGTSTPQKHPFARLDLAAKPMNIDAVCMLSLSCAELAAIGVDRSHTGIVEIYNKENKGIRRIGMPDTWGLISRPDDANPTVPSGLTVPEFYPIVVTNAQGQRRMVRFDSKRNNLKASGMKQPIGIGFPNGEAKMEMTVEMSKDGTSNIRESKKEIRQVKKSIVMVKRDSMSIGDNTDLLQSIGINADSLIRIAMKMKANGTPGEHRYAITEVLENNCDIDTVMASGCVSSIFNEMEEFIASVNNLVPVWVPSNCNGAGVMPGSPDAKGMILWYEPTEAFLSAIPEQYRVQLAATNPGLMPDDGEKPTLSTTNDICYNSSSRQGAIVKTAIHPNPAKESTHVLYSLSGERSVSFAVHNILGHQIMQVGSADTRAAGDWEADIDVSKLQPGMYLLVMTTDRGEQSIQRLVVER